MKDVRVARMQTFPTLVFGPITVLYSSPSRNVLETTEIDGSRHVPQVLYHASTVDYSCCHKASSIFCQLFLGTRKIKIHVGTYRVKVWRRRCQQRPYHFGYAHDSDHAIKSNNRNFSTLL